MDRSIHRLSIAEQRLSKPTPAPLTHWVEKQPPDIVSVRLKLLELDGGARSVK